MKKIFCFLLCLIIYTVAISQDTTANEVREGTGVRANEKIYVVAAVLSTILAGLIIYVVRLDRKITKMERGAS